MIKNRISLFLATFLIIGFFFLALPEKGYSGLPAELGCCVDGDICLGCGGSLDCAIIGDPTCDLLGGVVLLLNQVCVNGDFCAGAPTQFPGCCVRSEGNCINGEAFNDCNSDGGIAWFPETNCSEVPECPDPKVNVPIPTLSEWGLIAMAGVLGIIGFMVIRRKKVTA